MTLILCTLLFSCNDKTEEKPLTSLSDSSLVNTKHLDHLYVPVTFSNGKKLPEFTFMLKRRIIIGLLTVMKDSPA